MSIKEEKRKKTRKRSVRKPKKVNLRVRQITAGSGSQIASAKGVSQARTVRREKAQGDGFGIGWDASALDQSVSVNSAMPELAARREGFHSYEREDRDKRLMMWSGVFFFMLLVTVGWIYNMKQSFGRMNADEGGNFAASDWSQMTDDLSDKLEQLKEDLGEIRSHAETPTAGTSSLPVALFQAGDIGSSTATSTPAVTEEDIEALKDKLEAEIDAGL